MDNDLNLKKEYLSEYMLKDFHTAKFRQDKMAYYYNPKKDEDFFSDTDRIRMVVFALEGLVIDVGNRTDALLGGLNDLYNTRVNINNIDRD